MKTAIINKLLAGSLLLSSVMVFTSCDEDDGDLPAQPNTVVKVATDNGFTTLVGAIAGANLTATLNGTGPFTVFAPTNAAFSAITVPSNQTQLSSLLRYHVLPGTIRAADVPSPANGLTVGVATVNGDSVYVKRNATGVYINGVKVDQADVTATNGVVHVLGTVLNAPSGNIVQTAIAAGFDSLAKAVTVASTGAGSEDLLSALSNTQGLTVFAPTNAAFTALLPSLGVTSIDAIPKGTLINVLKYHVLTFRGFSSDLSDALQLPTLLGSDKRLTFTLTGGARVLGAGNGGTNSNITAVNVMARNGVIHIIDRVLLPL
ncbi:MAG: fasciclin domain-containing protein [Chitinophagaceae bacterium]|nr:fasciclin domain-containing protein [Chitinophagaceae bacterium]